MGKHITLCMIVRDEEHSLPETFRSFEDDFDHVVVVDTGSTDGTMAVAAGEGATIGEFEWCDDFSAARNYALSQCSPASDWIIMPDADECLDPDARGKLREAIDAAGEDVSAIRVTMVDGDRTWPLWRAFRRTRCHWERPTHNVLVVDEGRVIDCREIRFIHDRSSRGDEAREARSKQRTAMNKRNLRNAVRKDPDDARSWFYLGMTVQEEPCPQRAINHYRRCLKVSTWGEERYEARRRLAQCFMATDQLPLAVEQLVLAHGEDGRRAECAYWLGELYANGRAYERARLWYEVAANRADPDETGCVLFVDRRCYGQGARARLEALDGLIEGGTANTEQEWDERYKQGISLSARHKSLLREIARRANGLEPDAVLDVGAGTGLLIDMIAAETVVGIDFSREAAERHPQITYDHATSLATQDDDVYDVVTCVSLLEHVDSPSAVLQSIRRVLKPGGKVIVSVPRDGAMDCAEHVREYTRCGLAEVLDRHCSHGEVVQFDAWWIAQGIV
jgi:tetratricopeptide (TPR) repeat protein